MIHIGTCSWTEKTLIQSYEFYPKGIKTAEQRLRYYASHFDTVEVDSALRLRELMKGKEDVNIL